jgi:hypothetical protein
MVRRLGPVYVPPVTIMCLSPFTHTSTVGLPHVVLSLLFLVVLARQLIVE